MPELWSRMPRVQPRWLWAWRIWYNLRAAWRHLRISRPLTQLLGPQYRRSRSMIEIDITYLCNLHCLNCNRSVTQAREAKHMTVTDITRFVEDSLSRGKLWRRIRVLGGEPTLHPQFEAIVDELMRYKASSPDTIIEIVTNGYGKKVQRTLETLPPAIMIDNSNKEGPVQPTFGPFNDAPCDDRRYRHASFSNGCTIVEDCGMGLTPMGYYPCAVAGGIDRILREQLGNSEMPSEDDDMLEATERISAL